MKIKRGTFVLIALAVIVLSISIVEAADVSHPLSEVTPIDISLDMNGLNVTNVSNVGVGTTDPAASLDIQQGRLIVNSSTVAQAAYPAAIFGLGDGSSVIGVIGKSNVGTTDAGYLGGNGYGVYGDGSTYGVKGYSVAGYGGYFLSAGDYGVFGKGTTYGLYANCTSASCAGVYAHGLKHGVEASGDTSGVYATGGTHGVYASGTYGVYGSGTSYGVYGSGITGVNGSGTTTGIYGNGTTYGLYGYGLTGVIGLWSENSSYVWAALATNNSGNEYGVKASANSASAINGYGGYFESKSSQNYNYGVYGYASSSSKTSYGVYGSADDIGVYGTGTTGVQGSGSTSGVFGQDSDNSGYGYLGSGDYGVKGYGNTAGLYGKDIDNTGYGYVGYGDYGLFGSGTTGVYGSGTTYGVYGYGGTWAGYFNGAAYVTDYLEADGGIHVGGSSDPGTDNLIVDGNVAVGTTSFDANGKARFYKSDANGIYEAILAGQNGYQGVYGRTTRSYGYGVYGYATGTTARGVYGQATGTGSYGVYGSGTSYDFYAGGTGVDYGPFTGGHDVKLDIAVAKTIQSGMLVSVTGETQIRYDNYGTISLSSTLPTVTLSNRINDKKIFGVFVSKRNLPKDYWYNASEGEQFGIVNALGDGRAWVTNINGDIEAGDYITSSIIPGYGMKQDDDVLHSYTLGKATEAVDWNKVNRTISYGGKEYKAYLIAVVYTSG